MTWGEVQVISLQKMFLDDEQEIKIEDLPDLREDADIGVYLRRMPGAMNEAMQRIKTYVQNTWEYDEEEKKDVVVSIQKIDKDTEDTAEIEMPESACVLLPLYIASQLYKEDDVGLATQYRNEFEVGLADLVTEIPTQREIVDTDRVEGWFEGWWY